jgi:hypothetical protein
LYYYTYVTVLPKELPHQVVRHHSNSSIHALASSSSSSSIYFESSFK